MAHAKSSAPAPTGAAHTDYPHSNSVTFEVPAVVGKARPRFVSTGRGARAFTPKATLEAEELVRSCFLEKAAEFPFETFPRSAREPMSVSVEVQRPIPKSRPARIDVEPDIYKPDGDNILKLVCDALNGCAWADDAQITDKTIRKLPRKRDVSPVTRVTITWERGERRFNHEQ